MWQRNGPFNYFKASTIKWLLPIKEIWRSLFHLCNNPHLWRNVVYFSLWLIYLLLSEIPISFGKRNSCLIFTQFFKLLDEIRAFVHSWILLMKTKCKYINKAVWSYYLCFMFCRSFLIHFGGASSVP